MLKIYTRKTQKCTLPNKVINKKKNPVKFNGAIHSLTNKLIKYGNLI